MFPDSGPGSSNSPTMATKSSRYPVALTISRVWGGGRGLSPCMAKTIELSFFQPLGFSAVLTKVSARATLSTGHFWLCRDAAANQSSRCQCACCRSVALFWPLAHVLQAFFQAPLLSSASPSLCCCSSGRCYHSIKCSRT